MILIYCFVMIFIFKSTYVQLATKLLPCAVKRNFSSVNMYLLAVLLNVLTGNTLQQLAAPLGNRPRRQKANGVRLNGRGGSCANMFRN